MPFDGIATDFALLNAQTVGDVLKHCSFPYTLTPLKKPDVFSSFYSETNNPRITVSQESGGKIESYVEGDIKLFAPLREAASIIAKHERRLARESKQQPYLIDSWYTHHTAYMSSRQEHGRKRHVDSAFSERKILSLVVNSGDEASLIVPHAHAYEVLSNSPFAHILKQPIETNYADARAGRDFTFAMDDSRHWRKLLRNIMSPVNEAEFDSETLAKFRETSDALFAGAIPMPTNTVYRICTLTPHVQPENIKSERVCLVSNTFYRRGSHPS